LHHTWFSAAPTETAVRSTLNQKPAWDNPKTVSSFINCGWNSRPLFLNPKKKKTPIFFSLRDGLHFLL
jgi:hypothetical protein